MEWPLYGGESQLRTVYGILVSESKDRKVLGDTQVEFCGSLEYAGSLGVIGKSNQANFAIFRE